MFEQYQSIPFTLDLNFMNIPINMIDMTDEGMEEFNSVISEVEKMNLNPIIRTKSGGISIDRRNWHQFPCWDIRTTKSMVEVTVITLRCYRFQFRKSLIPKEADDGKQLSGRTSFLKFRSMCASHGIRLEDYKISKEEGLAIKQSIPSPHIDITPCIEDVTWEKKVHHIDLHSAHMSGIALTFPSLRPVIEEAYNRRKENDAYKSILTHTWGYLQCEYVQCGYSHISKAGIEWTNRTIEELTERLNNSERLVLAHNTDGIWYYGDIYHGEGEGDGIGQWSNDYHDCTFRAKSKGAYEFIGYKKNETEPKYHAVVRGLTEYDKVKPRKEWTWGDIYKTGKVIGYKFDRVLNRVVKEDIEE